MDRRYRRIIEPPVAPVAAPNQIGTIFNQPMLAGRAVEQNPFIIEKSHSGVRSSALAQRKAERKERATPNAQLRTINYQVIFVRAVHVVTKPTVLFRQLGN
jgi:hypothetical protein